MFVHGTQTSTVRPVCLVFWSCDVRQPANTLQGERSSAYPASRLLTGERRQSVDPGEPHISCAAVSLALAAGSRWRQELLGCDCVG